MDEEEEEAEAEDEGARSDEVMGSRHTDSPGGPGGHDGSSGSSESDDGGDGGGSSICTTSTSSKPQSSADSLCTPPPAPKEGSLAYYKAARDEPVWSLGGQQCAATTQQAAFLLMQLKREGRIRNGPFERCAPAAGHAQCLPFQFTQEMVPSSLHACMHVGGSPVS